MIFEKLFKKEQYSCDSLLTDINGDPFIFYRGGSIENMSKRRFFTNCIKQAIVYDESLVYKTKVMLKNPVVIDCYAEEGYFNWEYLPIPKLNIYPEIAKKMLIEYQENRVEGHTKNYELSTDEIACFLQKKGFDAVLLKDTCEGILVNLPLYDLVLWDNNSLVETEDITAFADKESDIYTYKRLDLSKYGIIESEEDGIIRRSVLTENFSLIHRIVPYNDKEYNVNYVLCIRPQEYKFRIYYEQPYSGKYYFTYQIYDEGDMSYAASMGKEVYPADTNIMIKNFHTSWIHKIKDFGIEYIK